MKINIFDLDKTILCIDCENLLINKLKKKKIINKKIAEIFNKMYLKYTKNKLNFKKYINLTKKILKIKIIKKFLNNFHNLLKNKIYKLIYKIIKINTNNIISTSSNLKIIEKFCIKILKTKVIANSDKLKNYRKYKVYNILKYIINKNKIRKIIFYTDSINDLSMINFSNKSVLINPDEKLTKLFQRKKIKCLFIKTRIKINK
ncbi:MAG: hypothetical protein AAYR31_00465 [Candidatus Vidania fulgoroideorum]